MTNPAALRNGGWAEEEPATLRAAHRRQGVRAYRCWGAPSYRDDETGFRTVLTTARQLVRA